RKADGLSVKSAAARVKEELSNGHKSEGQGASSQAADPWRMLVEELQAEVRRLEEENRWLRGRLEELQRLALPAPRRWRLWGWWRALKGERN
ncbi:MAG: hypothetical protein DRI26_07315, partial [Chloroflexi bacterium]